MNTNIFGAVGSPTPQRKRENLKSSSGYLASLWNSTWSGQNWDDPAIHIPKQKPVYSTVCTEACKPLLVQGLKSAYFQKEQSNNLGKARDEPAAQLINTVNRRTLVRFISVMTIISTTKKPKQSEESTKQPNSLWEPWTHRSWHHLPQFYPTNTLEPDVP